MDEATTDGGGRCDLACPREPLRDVEEYSVLASCAGFRPRSVAVPSPGGEIVVQLERAAAASVRVVRRSDHRPVPGAFVLFTDRRTGDSIGAPEGLDPAARFAVRCDAHGVALATPPAECDGLRVAAWSDGIAPQWVTLDIDGAAPTLVVLDDLSSAVDGFVVPPGDGTTVYALPADLPPVMCQADGAIAAPPGVVAFARCIDGRFSLRGLGHGAYRFVALQDGGARGAAAVVVPAAGAVAIATRNPRCLTITADSGGERRRVVLLSLQATGSPDPHPFGWRGVALPSGGLRVERLDPGTYDVLLRIGDELPTRLTATLGGEDASVFPAAKDVVPVRVTPPGEHVPGDRSVRVTYRSSSTGWTVDADLDQRGLLWIERTWCQEPRAWLRVEAESGATAEGPLEITDGACVLPSLPVGVLRLQLAGLGSSDEIVMLRAAMRGGRLPSFQTCRVGADGEVAVELAAGAGLDVWVESVPSGRVGLLTLPAGGQGSSHSTSLELEPPAELRAHFSRAGHASAAVRARRVRLLPWDLEADETTAASARWKAVPRRRGVVVAEFHGDLGGSATTEGAGADSCVVIAPKTDVAFTVEPGAIDPTRGRDIEVCHELDGVAVGEPVARLPVSADCRALGKLYPGRYVAWVGGTSATATPFEVKPGEPTVVAVRP